MNELEKHVTREALLQSIAFFQWLINELKNFDLEAMTEKEEKLHLRKIENYQERKDALGKLLEELK